MEYMWNTKQTNLLLRIGTAKKTAVDLDIRIVGGDGFEPPTPAL